MRGGETLHTRSPSRSFYHRVCRAPKSGTDQSHHGFKRELWNGFWLGAHRIGLFLPRNRRRACLVALRKLGKEGGTWRTQSLFHVGRLAGFFVLGGVIGLIGSSFHIGITANVVLGIIVAAVMFILGVEICSTYFISPNDCNSRCPRGPRGTWCAGASMTTI